jgi:opacity protein-like surface antigen
MKTPTCSTLGTLLGAVLALPAAAQETGGYLGLGLGLARIQADAQQVANSIGYPNVTTIDVGSGTARIYGGYKVSPNLGFEAFLGSLGVYDANVTLLSPYSGYLNAEITTGTFGVTANGYLPVTESVSLVAKGGLALWTVEQKFTGPGGAVKISEDGWTPVIGAGVVTSLTTHVRLRAEFEYFNKIGKDETTGETSVKHFQLGLEYAF